MLKDFTMLMRLFASLCLLTLSQAGLANTGAFFNVSADGPQASLSVTLCLNAREALSCQTFAVNNTQLHITTTIPNHTYPYAGIKINTPGYSPLGCSGTSHDFCLFSASDSAMSRITVSPEITTNVSSLALKVNGVARELIITNTSPYRSVTMNYRLSSALPPGTTIRPASCGIIAPGGSCILTVTPGAIPSAAPGDTTPIPIAVIFPGSTKAYISILTYGSVYENGYLFSIDDTTPITGSIGGKVMSLVDEAVHSITAILWSSTGVVTVADHSNIPGIYDTSAAGAGSCNGNSDGACNTKHILNFYIPFTTFPLSFYAAGICTETIGAYSDWYLPAICEMGYDSLNIGNGCGSSTAPTFQNIQSNLVENGNIGNLSGSYWSSTEYTKLLGNPADDAWVQTFGVGSSFQTGSNKGINFAVRCVRALT